MSRLTKIKSSVAALVAVVALCAVALFASSATAFVDKDCSDFPTWKKAQKYFKKHGGPRRDPSGLDADHDGIACEDLR
jgi:Excalibur calcium-binding domain